MAVAIDRRALWYSMCSDIKIRSRIKRGAGGGCRMSETIIESAAEVPVLRLQNVSKSYGHITALQNVSLDIGSGEVVGLVGDNGAGKATLINIIAGAIRASSGKI